ncbi:hypothetical protein LC55x_1732 [Lysobacter capsici]|nr:hypothetical protein LC55x_1732 [Lysobacter capsici]
MGVAEPALGFGARRRAVARPQRGRIGAAAVRLRCGGNPTG